MGNTSPRRRRLRARPLLVAVGAAALASTGACGTHFGATPNPCAVAGGAGDCPDTTPDMSVPAEPPDMKPANGD
jgi:hypothetical protein